ncbi:type II secretion system protein [Patescibacteria group bacterium]|nr:type II secretion system protein [Patescibacteria group bacterium]
MTCSTFHLIAKQLQGAKRLVRASSFKKKGFSLTEFLIVISIIGIFSAITFPNYRSTQQQLILQRSASKLAQNIRKVQEMAISAKECPPSICGGPGSIIPPGYGIYLKKDDLDYLLYADVNPAAGNEKYDSGNDKVVETIPLETGVEIKSVSPASMSINFKPPDPEVKISGTDTDDAAEAVITLVVEGTSFEKKIIVNKAGLIYVE